MLAPEFEKSLLAVGTSTGQVFRAAKRGFCMIDVTPYQSDGGVTAWVYRSCGSTTGVSLKANTTPEVPIVEDTIPVSTIPLPTAPAA